MAKTSPTDSGNVRQLDKKCNKCGKVNDFVVMCKQAERPNTRSNTSRIKTEVNEISQQEDDNEGEISGF